MRENTPACTPRGLRGKSKTRMSTFFPVHEKVRFYGSEREVALREFEKGAAGQEVVIFTERFVRR